MTTTNNPWLQGIGLAVFLLGLALAIWARRYLGRNWGMPMSQKVDPELVTTGPYRRVRHPIYSGIILAMIGTSDRGEPLWLIAVLLLGAYFVYSAFVEERLMGGLFPESYPEYKPVDQDAHPLSPLSVFWRRSGQGWGFFLGGRRPPRRARDRPGPAPCAHSPLAGLARLSRCQNVFSGPDVLDNRPFGTEKAKRHRENEKTRKRNPRPEQGRRRRGPRLSTPPPYLMPTTRIDRWPERPTSVRCGFYPFMAAVRACGSSRRVREPRWGE